MLQEKPRPATYADIEALPSNVVGEIVHGALYTHPRPSPRHGAAAYALGNALGSFQTDGGGSGGDSGRWIFIVEPELHLGPHVLVPDLAGWRRERLPEAPATPYFETAPDWVCEVLSPSTMRLDRAEKLPLYGEFAVQHAWYVDPLAKTLEVFALTDSKWLLAGTFSDADPVSAPPFEARTFPLDGLWPFG